MAYFLGIDISTTATKALLIDEQGRRGRRRLHRIRLRNPPARCGASRTRPSGGTAPCAASARCWRRPASTADAGRRRRPDRPDARPGAARRGRARCCARPSCGTTSAPPPSATRSARRLGKERLIADHRQRRPDRLHRPQDPVGARARAGGLCPRRATSCCPRTTCATA